MTMVSSALQVAGVLSVFTMPAAVWVLIGMGRGCQKLERRNAAQGVTIAGLQRRLDRRGLVDASNPADLAPPGNETTPSGTGLAKSSQSRPTGLTGGFDGLDENGCARN